MAQNHRGDSNFLVRQFSPSIGIFVILSQLKKDDKKRTTVNKKVKKKDISKNTQTKDHRPNSQPKGQFDKELKRTQRSIKIVLAFVVIFIILAFTLGYIYFYSLSLNNNNSETLIVDTDSDGLEDSWELDNGLDPFNWDTDYDGLPDGWEVKYALNPLSNDSGEDTDQDGFDKNLNGILELPEFFSNLEEYELGTDPRLTDSDSDGMPDGWEVFYREKYELVENNYWLSDRPIKLDPKNPNDANDDFDFKAKKSNGGVVGYELEPDKLTNLQEFSKGTDPTDPDTDNDGLTDYDEVERYGTSPINVDTDHDNLWDGWEIEYGGIFVGLDPIKADTDGDGENDTFEDLDSDTLWNLDEYKYGTSPIDVDSDKDGLTDDWEEKYWNQQPNDHPNPTIYDSELDSDNDDLPNLLEFKYNTNPKDRDTDDDGLFDGLEVWIGFNGLLINGSYHTSLDMPRYYTNPLKIDTDDDKLNDSEEVEKGEDGYYTNATNPDSDGDGINDIEEVSYGSDGFITNPDEVDTDHDLLTDLQEILGTYGYITHPTKPDHDNDGLLDGEEVLTDFHPFFDFDTNVSPYNCIDTGPVDGTNPLDNDTDGDGMEDGWEAKWGEVNMLEDKGVIDDFDEKYGYARYGFNYSDKLSAEPGAKSVWVVNPLDPRDKFDDLDEDGMDDFSKFTNIEEFTWRTNPIDLDSDDDGMEDGWEAFYYDYSTVLGIYGPDPTIADGDLDLDNDGVTYYINNKKYTDAFTNIEEYNERTDPNNDDTDGNGKKDYFDIWFGDNDGDGLLNGFEIIFNGKKTDPNGYSPDKPNQTGFDPEKNDTDNNGITDDLEDYDGDGYSNWDEQYIYGEMNKGIILNGPSGCSDPTNSSITPETVLKSSVRGTRSCNDNQTRGYHPIIENGRVLDFVNHILLLDNFITTYRPIIPIFGIFRWNI